MNLDIVYILCSEIMIISMEMFIHDIVYSTLSFSLSLSYMLCYDSLFPFKK